MTDSAVMAPLRGAVLRLHRSSGVPLAFAATTSGRSKLRLQDCVGSSRGALEGVNIDVGQGLGGKVVAVNRPIALTDYFGTPRITHHYDAIIAREGLRAMAAAPVIVDRTPVAVLYCALRTPATIGDRTLDLLALEARAVEQEIAAKRAVVELDAHGCADHDLRGRLDQIHAELRLLARTVDDHTAAEILRIARSATTVARTAPEVVLTPREVDVLSLAALGYNNARIASRLGVTAETVRGYVKAAMRKLGAATRLEAVVTARRQRLLP